MVDRGVGRGPKDSIAQESIAAPEEFDLSFQATGKSGAAYDATAIVGRWMS